MIQKPLFFESPNLASASLQGAWGLDNAQKSRARIRLAPCLDIVAHFDICFLGGHDRALKARFSPDLQLQHSCTEFTRIMATAIV